jgi:hypothetical protein
VGREDGGARPPGNEHERMQREAENRAGETPGGLSREDLGKLNRAEWDRDREAADEHAERRADADRRARDQRDAQQPGESIMDEVDPDNTAAMRSEGLMPDEGPVLTGGMLDALKDPRNMVRLAAMGLGLIGLLLLFWGLRVEAQQVGGQATPLTQTAQPTAAQTTSPTQAITPISAGPIVATQSGTVSAYSVENVQGTGLRYEWRHSATCGTHSGEGTAAYSWDHPHIPGVPNTCPEEAFHPSFVTVQIIDARNQAVVRQYAGGSRPGRGEVPAGGGVFTAQTTPTPAGTTAPASTATAPTVAAATTAPTAGPGGAVNFPATLGLVFLVGALGLWFGGPRLAGGPAIADPKDAEDPCAKEKARLAAAQAVAAAAEARLRELDGLAENAQSTQRDAAAKEQAANDAANAPGVSSYTNNAGQTVYTNAQQRAAIEGARAAATGARAAADAAQAAYNAAGGAGARRSAADDVFTTNRELRDAQAALDACLRIVSMSTPTPAPTPAGGATTTGGGGTTTGGGTGVGIGAGTGTSDGTRTRSRGCPDGPTRNEATTEHRFSMHDLGNAQIESEGTRLNDDDSHARGFLDHLGRVDSAFKAGKIGSGLAQGEVVGPALDAVDFPDFLTYFGEIREKLDETTRRLLEQLRQHRRQGTYTIRFTTHHFLLTCRKWEECVNDQYVAKSEVKLTLMRSSESTRGPEVLTDETSRSRWLDGTLGAARGSNERAEQAADTFRQECGGQ